MNDINVSKMPFTGCGSSFTRISIEALILPLLGRKLNIRGNGWLAFLAAETSCLIHLNKMEILKVSQ